MAVAMKPLCIDLFCGLGGWTEGFLAEGYDVVGFDIERHAYGEQKYPAQLVIQDVLTLHGHQFRNAAVIVASPPCQEYSYMAMPWSRAKAIAAEYRAGTRDVKRLTALFDACFRIAREANVPLVVENVKGAQPWVGRAKANYGSFYLWGGADTVNGNIVCGGVGFGSGILHPPSRHAQKFNPDGTEHPQGSWFKIADSKDRGSREALKVPGFNFHYEKTGEPGGSFQPAAVAGIKAPGQDWGRFKQTGEVSPDWKFQGIAGTSNAANCTAVAKDGRKGEGGWFGSYAEMKAAGRGSPNRYTSSNSLARKAASALIAKIPFELSSHVARCFKPRKEAAA